MGNLTYPSQRFMHMLPKLGALEVIFQHSFRHQVFDKRDVANSGLEIRASIVYSEKISKFSLRFQSIHPVTEEIPKNFIICKLVNDEK